jgi:hypothetical protein
MRYGGVGILIALFFLIGCTRIVVRKDPGRHDKGFRFNRPKPYLYIGPVAQPAGNQQGGTQNQPGSAQPAPAPDAKGKTTPSAPLTGTLNDNLIKVGIELKYLPDYNEEYSVRLKPGLGTGTLSFTLEEGWKLTSVNMSSDSKIPELISSFANLIGAVRGTGAGGGGTTATPGPKGKLAVEGGGDTMSIIVDTRPDVPLGFYEAIIATDPQGRKTLFGWRYVGFLPFEGCPVQPIVNSKTVCCTEDELWGIVATPNSIKFDRLSHIRDLDSHWPYRYKTVKKDGSNGDVAPPPNTVVQARTEFVASLKSVDTKNNKITVIFETKERIYAVAEDADIIIDTTLYP